jgi:two-component system, LytTR family, sensor kinase
MIRREHIVKGLWLGLMLSVVATLPRILRSEIIDYRVQVHGFLFWFINFFFTWIIQNSILDGRKKGQRLLHMKAFLLGSMANILLSAILLNAPESVQQGIPPYIETHRLNEWQPILIIVFRGIILSSFCLLIARFLLNLQEKHVQQLEIQKLINENNLAKLHSLKQQISPHFLFNSLSTLRTLTPDEETKTFVSQLSSVYRYILQSNTTNTSYLEDELKFLQSYFHIINTRFPSSLKLCVNIREENKTKQIPTLTLQLLFENAIKHNAFSSFHPMTLDIYEIDPNTICFSNNTTPKESVLPSEGVGLTNIEKRYNILAGQSISISQTNTHFRVYLPLLS